MSIATIQFVPISATDWLRWGHTHWLDSQIAANAVGAKGGPGIWVPPLDPWRIDDPETLETLLSWEQQFHLNMNNATGQQSQDLQGVDFKNPAQREDWIYLDWVEHQAWAVALSI